MIIDSLTHILPKEVSSYIEKYKKIDKKFDSIFDKDSKIINCEELIESMKNNKIDKSNLTDKPICIIIGPEGDFSEAEREEILSFKGVQSLKINENILRSETAVISAISIINYVIT